MRKIAYAITAALFIFAVVIKARQITEKEKVVVPSIASEWKERGFPVDVEPIVRSSIVFITKVSGTLQKNNRIVADVPWEIFKELQIGQQFSSSKMEQSFSGVVHDIEPQSNPETGLFRVVLRIVTPVDLPENTITVCFVGTGILKKTLKIPLTAVRKEDEREYCWIVQDNKAVKKYISLGRINTEYAQVLNGVSEGDLVVVAGANELIEVSMIHIHQAPEEQP